MNTCVIFHSIDLDGWMSAAIVKHWFIETYKKDYYILNEDGSIIAKNFGGGGHAGAAGFLTTDINLIIIP